MSQSPAMLESLRDLNNHKVHTCESFVTNELGVLEKYSEGARINKVSVTQEVTFELIKSIQTDYHNRKRSNNPTHKMLNSSEQFFLKKYLYFNTLKASV